MAHGEAGRVLEDTTLDEPVSETLNRELRAIAKKLHKVAWMNSDSKVCVCVCMRACVRACLPACLRMLACRPAHQTRTCGLALRGGTERTQVRAEVGVESGWKELAPTTRTHARTPARTHQPAHARGPQAELRNWDLWGPLVLCLVLAITLSMGTSQPEEVVVKGKTIKLHGEDESAPVFAAVFVIVWCGAAVVTINAVLLGGTVSFFQSICVLGYCVFPLTVSALVSMGVGWTGCASNVCLAARLLTTGVGLVWSTKASMGFLDEVVSPKRSALAAYPVYLFYAAIAWIILIRSSP